jgi:alpha-tubulin suppressor-like RCC1 family protein
MAIGITVAGSVVIGSGVGIPFDNIAATAVTGTKTIQTGISQNFSTIDVAYGMAPITYAISPSLSITGLTFNTGNGNITGTATSTTAGISYSVTATDQYSRSASASFTLVVELGFSTTLEIASRTVTAGVNETGFVPVTAQGGTAPVTFGISPTIVGLGLSFASSTGTISGNATSTIAATPYKITATDAISQSSFQTFTMTVAAPALTTNSIISSRTVQIGSYDSFTPVTLGSTGYGSKTWSTSPSLSGTGLSIDSATGTISGTPTSDFSTSYAVTVTDGLGTTSSKSVTINVAFVPAYTVTDTYAGKLWNGANNNGYVDSGSTLFTWGNNNVGQLGFNDTINRSFVTQLATSWAAIATDISSSLAIKSDGTLWSWGVNTSGQLGLGDTITRSSPVQIGSATNWTSVSKQGYIFTSSAINSSNQLWVWGFNTSGQLGDGTTINKSNPVQISGSWVQAIISSSSLALDSNYKLYTWGISTNGRLGDGTTVSRSSPVQINSGSRYIDVSVGIQHLVAMRDDFTIWTWGTSVSGRTGLGDTVERSVPTQIGSSSWIMVQALAFGGVGIKNDGTLWSWGINAEGQLGINDTLNRSSPVQIGSAAGWSVIAPSSYKSMAINGTGQVYVWGNNNGGGYGDGTTIARSSPVQVKMGTLPTSTGQVIGGTSTNLYFIKYLESGGSSLWAAGSNGTNGSLGQNTKVPANRSVPLQIGSGPLNQWYAVAQTQGLHGYAIKADGTLWAWGYNLQGQLGLNDRISRSSPVQVGSSSNWTILMSGGGTNTGLMSGAINSLGQLFVWGFDGGFGQLGLGTTGVSRSNPTQLPGSWISISGGAGTTYAINSVGKLFSWGSSGQNAAGSGFAFGDGITSNRSSPVQVGNSSWSQVTASGGNTLLIRSDRTLWSWGDNTNGQVGDNTSISRSLPVQIGVSSWNFVHSSADACYAIRLDFKLFSWGLNSSGQLGLGDTLNRSSPTQIGTSSWVTVAAGANWVAGLTAVSNLIFAWGTNGSGQFGINTTASRSSPTQIGVNVTPTFDYLIVGGGGGGGGNRGGGGGGGGYVEGIGYQVAFGQAITVTVGASGAAGTENSNGGNGGNSSISSAYGGTVTAYGGGGGANNFTATGGNSINGNNGGSGGGGGMTNASSGFGIGGKGVYPGSSYVDSARQGTDGGAGSISDSNGGGGGGAFSQGVAATTSVGGDGGRGREWRDGVTYAGGGGGGANGLGTGGTGGAGGGGNGVTGSTAAVAGGTNTGGGGGGGGAGNTAGAAGGTGVVILAYPTIYPAASTTGTVVNTTGNGYRYYKFTTDGTITV